MIQNSYSVSTSPNEHIFQWAIIEYKLIRYEQQNSEVEAFILKTMFTYFKNCSGLSITLY